MRIIAGIRKGLKLSTPDGLDTRPTTDRVKESVFNIIQAYLPADRVLDLFAGSGALGIEAISRRSSLCVFVEHNRKAFELIHQNIVSARFEENSELFLRIHLHILILFLPPLMLFFWTRLITKAFYLRSLTK